MAWRVELCSGLQEHHVHQGFNTNAYIHVTTLVYEFTARWCPVNNNKKDGTVSTKLEWHGGLLERNTARALTKVPIQDEWVKWVTRTPLYSYVEGVVAS